MAGYKLTFDGSLNERRDVTEVTSTSLLDEVVTIYDPGPTAANFYPFGSAVGQGKWFSFPTFPGILDQIQWDGVTIANNVPKGALSHTVAPWTYHKGTFVVNNAGADQYLIRREQTTITQVTIAESTPVPGVAPTPGTPTTATPETVQNGIIGLPGPPVVFGAELFHNSNRLTNTKYLPPADNNQDAELQLTKSRIFTAAASSISASSTGMPSTSAQSLLAGNTSVLLKEYKDAEEGTYPIIVPPVVGFSEFSMLFDANATSPPSINVQDLLVSVQFWTLNLWFKRDLTQGGETANNMIAGTAAIPADNGMYIGYDSSGFLTAYDGDGVPFAGGTSTYALDDQWHNIIVMSYGSQTILFVDGVQVLRFTATTVFVDLLISSPAAAFSMRGSLAHVDVFDTSGAPNSIGSAQITDLHNDGDVLDPLLHNTVLGITPVMSLSMGDHFTDNGNAVWDSIGLANVTIDDDPVTIVENSPVPIVPAPSGFSTKARNMSAGSLGSFEIAVNETAWTASCWYRWNVVTNPGSLDTQIIMGTANTNFDSGIEVRIDNTANRPLQVRDNDTGATIMTGTANMSDGNWHHIVLVESLSGSGDMTLFVDGVQDASDTSGLYSANMVTARIGRHATVSGSIETGGYIAHADFFNFNMSAGQVNTLYHDGEGYNPNQHMTLFGTNSIVSFPCGEHMSEDASNVYELRTNTTFGVNYDPINIIEDSPKV